MLICFEEECFRVGFTQLDARTFYVFFLFPVTGRGTCSFERHINEELYMPQWAA